MVQKLISVIVPVYNVGAFLEECLNSICHQLERDFELIIINDGSTDRSAEIIRYYAEKFVSIRVLTQNNLGLSAARNAGLEVAVGKYIWFVDGDDFVEENALNCLKSALIKYPDIDMLRFGYFHFSDETRAILKTFQPESMVPLAASVYFQNREMFHEACMGLYSRNYLFSLNIHFAEGVIFEDTIFNILAYSAGGRILVLPFPLYWYRKRSGSLSRSATSLQKINSVIYLLKICDKIIDTNKGTISTIGFVADKKFDFINLLIDHLFYFESYTFTQKIIAFQKVNHRVPLLKKNRLTIKIMKLFLRSVPKLYSTMRLISLKKGWCLPNL